MLVLLSRSVWNPKYPLFVRRDRGRCGDGASLFIADHKDFLSDYKADPPPSLPLWNPTSLELGEVYMTRVDCCYKLSSAMLKSRN
ncbi:hypothetical protein Bpfe_030045 [Biomphalaria pfeifferi]|uniref:Uncharacterized protein n=1 Tax=Biomphalaria pfeifferi TaxID=112525 RepID=A0AAD8ARI8_BIOPF|nr:hypothetical protein Bpfe_030045 [Biomphalaria pfeifferi]